jgi:SAM-dependent methyltransferase
MSRTGDLLRKLLAHPRLRGMDLNDPRLTSLRRQIILGNDFLGQIYLSWYDELWAAVPAGPGSVLELGSGGGFLKKVQPEVVTSDVVYLPHVDLVLDGRWLPFADCSLRAIIFTNVLHHIPQVRLFLADAARVVRSGGVITMIEPWVTGWSRFVYTRLHEEDFDTGAGSWEFPSCGPVSGANGALPWIIFARDGAKFQEEFSQWRLEAIRLDMPFRYLISGGVSLRPLMPGWSYGFWTSLEKLLTPWMSHWAMFAQVTLRRV